MTLKTKMSLLVFLTSLSIVSIGFSSWSITAEATAELNGNIDVDNVEGKKLADFGFSALNSNKSIKYVKHQDSTNGTGYSVTDYSVTVSTTLDMTNENLNNLSFDDGIYSYVYIKFAISSYSNITKNKIESLSISLTYEPSLSFTLIPVENNIFKIKLKSKEELSLYSIAMYDDYSKFKNNVVPIDFKFNFDYETLNDDIFISNYKYSVSFYFGG